MTEKYTPEKVAELVAEARDRGDLRYEPTWTYNLSEHLHDLANALTAVSAERDRLHKAIMDIQDWMNNPGSVSWPALEGILLAALDKEGNDDE